jgi:putative hydrolase of the HAD superfamily
MALEAVFLDIGGTLLTEQPRREQIYAAAATARGVEVSAPEVRALMYATASGLPREVDGHFRYSEGWFGVFIERLFVEQLGLDRATLPGLERELFGRFSDPSTFRLYDGALELLDGLRERGLTLGVVSNWSERLPEILAGLGVAERVDFVLVSAVERCEKPEPELFRRALAQAGVEPGCAAHAGNDLVLDVRGARDCGILPVLVDHGDRQTPPRRDPPDRVTDLFQLAEWTLERAR